MTSWQNIKGPLKKLSAAHIRGMSFYDRESKVPGHRGRIPQLREQMVCLADTIAQVSEEIFEHYKALCDLLKGQLHRVRRICREEGCKKAFPQETDRQLLARALESACRQKVVLAEKYEELAKELVQ